MSSFIYLLCIQLGIFQTVYTQCANRVVQGPNGPIELLPNQVLVPPPGVPYLGPILPPGVPPQGRPILIPGPNPPPCKGPPQPILYSAPGQALPTEYTNIASLGPVLANIAPQLAPTPPNVLPGNVIVPNVASGIPNLVSGNVVVPNVGSGFPNLLSGLVVSKAASAVLPVAETYSPTIIHDSSVANSLANALQLLVVSSLLGNTLPVPYEPPCYEPYLPGFSYIY